MNAPMPDLSALLNSLLSNPAALSGILSLIGNIRKTDTPPIAENPVPADPEGQTAEVSAEPAEGEDQAALSTETPVISLPSPPHRSRICEKRKGLLGALRPYLSPERCRTVDTLIRVSDLVDAFREGEHT